MSGHNCLEAGALLFRLASENPSARVLDSPVPRFDIPKERRIFPDPFCHNLRCLFRDKRPCNIAYLHLSLKVEAYGDAGFVRGSGVLVGSNHAQMGLPALA